MRRVSVASAVVVLLLTSIAAAQTPGVPGGQGGAPQGMAGAQGGMPDVRMMSGIPMPMGDVPDGAVTVRVVKGDLSNGLAGQVVELVVNGKSQSRKTDDGGRAEFSGLAANASVKASVTVEGERLQSEEFTMPAKGGVRLLLAATGAVSGAPAVEGTVTFGPESRLAIQFDDAALNVFYLLEIMNGGNVPVNPAAPIAFELPPDATGASVIEGSSPQAQVKGRYVTVNGPFQPGRTTVQVAYQLPPDGDTRTIVQPFPVAFSGVAVVVQKAGALRMQSPQVTSQREMPGDGSTYIFGTGPALAAGRPLSVELSGLPHHDTWPRNLAIALALVILCAGGWYAIARPQSGEVARRHELESRRDQLFAELLRLEDAGRGGQADGAQAVEQRRALMNELERIYGELDRGAPAPGGDKGIAA